MKICLVNSFFPPWRGGAETYVYEISKRLVARGHEVRVACAADPLRPGTTDEDGVRVTRLPGVTRVYGTPIIRNLKKTLQEMDTEVFHGNFPSPYIAYNVAKISAKRGRPAVLTWHNDLPYVTLGARALIEIHDRLILPTYIRNYKRVISTTETYSRESRVLPKLGNIVTVIPNGVDCERFNPRNDRTAIRDRYGLGDRFVLLFVGALTRWHGYKGLDTLLSALSLVDRHDVLLLVVGEGGLKEQYRQMAYRLQIQQNVIFAGNVTNQQLPLYYAAANALALPSKDISEGFGLTLLEANATGLPVISTNVGGIPGVVTAGYNGLLVEPNDIHALANAILRLVSQSAEGEEMGRNGRIVAEAHDWSIVAARTENVYQEALAL